MFTGIVETIGKVVKLTPIGSNVQLQVSSPISSELKVDQSVAHNGACLTVTKIVGDIHYVDIVDETLQKTNLGELKEGDIVNLERSMKAGGRLDGHVVQGHVDQVATCIGLVEKQGSWVFTFEHAPDGGVTVEKGSVCVNGMSLTVINSNSDRFSVEIIPYTYENTNINQISVGNTVNLEFDILGKYIEKLLSRT